MMTHLPVGDFEWVNDLKDDPGSVAKIKKAIMNKKDDDDYGLIAEVSIVIVVLEAVKKIT